MVDGRQVERVLADAGRARRRLSLGQVIDAGLPAVYLGFGDRLLFMDDTIYDARDPSSLAEILRGVRGEPDLAVGLEFGWRHQHDCTCLFCAGRSTDEAA